MPSTAYLAIPTLILAACVLVGLWDTAIAAFVHRHWPGIELSLDFSAVLLGVILLVDTLALALLVHTTFAPP